MNTGDLILLLNTNKLNKEFLYYLDTPGKLTDISKNNEIIKYFQQDIFYKRERELWEDPKIQEKIILNRQKYLKKSIDDLTIADILSGFKRSGIYYGYSHFNPLWFKWFIEKYNIKTCFDPCGGWGHRLLGGLNLTKYIYNDLSLSTKNNVDNIIEFFDITNTITYNNDARTFIPNENYESIFTCPPYFNKEHYECGDFLDVDDYNNFIKDLFKNFYVKKECYIFGMVIQENLLDTNIYKPNEIFPLNIHKASHIVKNKRYKENLYIFMK